MPPANDLIKGSRLKHHFTIDNKCDLYSKEIKIAPTPKFSLGNALSIYPLLDLVLDYLGQEDLKKAATINKFWRDTANAILRRRTKTSWIMHKSSDSHFSHSKNYLYSNSSLGLIFCDLNTIKLNRKCYYRKNIKNKYKSIYFSDFIFKHLVPPWINCGVVFCPNVAPFICKDAPLLGFSHKMDFTAIFLPNIPNVVIMKFQFNGPIDFEAITNVDLHPKALLLMHSLKGGVRFKNFDLPDSALSSWFEVAIAGGIVNNTVDMGHLTRSAFSIGFMEKSLTESSFNAYSLVMKGQYLSDSEIEKKLRNFKDNILLRDNSIAFRVSCHMKPNQESEIALFVKVFPKTQLLSFDTFGEFGLNRFQTKKPIHLKKCKNINLFHQYSTTILLLTWGTIIHVGDLIPLCFLID